METAVHPEEPKAAAQTTASKMFRYSQFVDVGDGALECEHSRDGQCENTEHFHAWCRLPNPYQHEDIRKKSMAAKARRIRELKDPESDSSVVLDLELETLTEKDMLDELLMRDWAQDFMRAGQDVEEREEFLHIEQDREEYERLSATEAELPEEQQSDEFKALIKHLADHAAAVRERLEAIQNPRREALANDPGSLRDKVRNSRVEDEGDRAFMDRYNAWMWFVGTFNVALHPTLNRPHLPKWEEMGHPDRPEAGTMFSEAPEVITMLKTVFNGLQIALQAGSSGN